MKKEKKEAEHGRSFIFTKIVKRKTVHIDHIVYQLKNGFIS